MDDNTPETGGTPTPESGGNPTPQGGTPFKTFESQQDFDNHAAGIKRDTESKLLKKLGVENLDEIKKYKDAYEASLSDAEKQVKELGELTEENKSLKSQLEEANAINQALVKITGTKEDVSQYVKMAKGLVDENTTIEQALEKVFALAKIENTKPTGSPPPDKTGAGASGVNPFASDTFNLTEQASLKTNDVEKAREYFRQANGTNPSW